MVNLDNLSLSQKDARLVNTKPIAKAIELKQHCYPGMTQLALIVSLSNISINFSGLSSDLDKKEQLLAKPDTDFDTHLL